MNALASHLPKGIAGYLGTPLFLLVWGGLSQSGLVDPLLLPSPLRVLGAAGDIGPDLYLHLATTTGRVVIGFLACVLVGTGFGVWMQRNRMGYAILDGLIETWRPVPPVALVPFFVLLFGFSEMGRLILVLLGGSLVTTVTVVEALHRTPPTLVQLGLVSGLSKRDMYRLVLVPSAVPRLTAGFRIALALVFSLVVVSEFLGARYGLGYLVSVSKVTLATPTMLLCIIILGLVGFVADAVLRGTLALFTRWEPTAKEARL